MTVACLISLTSPETYVQCTLSLETLRVGFPNANIIITLNDTWFGRRKWQEVYGRCRKIDAFPMMSVGNIHHADWIKDMIFHNCSAPVVIVDPDMIFWENCEGFKFDSLMAGMFVPDHWNHWSQCAYRSRLHTSFLWINDPASLLAALDNLWITEHASEYLPCDLFRPVMTFDYGRPTFYDTVAILCHALPLNALSLFGEEHLNCYDHLNSASFFQQMMSRWDTDAQRDEFKRVHDLATTNPVELRGLWRKTKAYYEQQHQVLLQRMNESAWNAQEKTSQVS